MSFLRKQHLLNSCVRALKALNSLWWPWSAHLGPSLLTFTHIFRSGVSGQSWALSPWPELSQEWLSTVNIQPCLWLLKEHADLVWDLQVEFLAWPHTCLVTVGLPSNYRTWSWSVDWLWTCVIISTLADDLDSWLNLATVSRSILLHLSRPLLMAPALPENVTMLSSPSFREQAAHTVPCHEDSCLDSHKVFRVHLNYGFKLFYWEWCRLSSM